jgi:hydroxyacylglutathione hydrolase
MPRATRIAGAKIEELLRHGAVVVDTRRAAAFAAGHVPGTINIPLTGSFTTWAGWLLPYDRDLYLLVDDSRADSAETAVRSLTMIGLDRVAGILGIEALAAWTAGGHSLGTVAQATAEEAAAMLARGEATIIDVRGAAEWEAGHLPGAPNVFVGHLPGHVDEIATDRPVILHCQGGSRSSIAASVLKARGVPNVINMTGGIRAWKEAGLPVATGADQDAVVPTTS